MSPSDGSDYIVDYYGARLTRLSITNETYRRTQLSPWRHQVRISLTKQWKLNTRLDGIVVNPVPQNQQCRENKTRGLVVSGIFLKSFKDFSIMCWVKVSGDLEWPPGVSKANWQTKDTFSCALSPCPPPSLFCSPEGAPCSGERERLNVRRAERTLGKHGGVVRLHLLWLAPELHLLNFVLVLHTHTHSCRQPPYPKENSGWILDDSLYLCLSPISFCFLPVWLSG